jgi:hypothetical protein
MISKLLYYLRTKKCREKTCKRRIPKDKMYCSYECGAYDGAWTIKEGWKKCRTYGGKK